MAKTRQERISKAKLLSAQGYVALAQNAAFHCRYESDDVKKEKDRQVIESDDNKDKNMDYETTLLQLAALNQQFIHAFRQLFPSVGTVLSFRLKCTTLSWLHDDLAFKDGQNLTKFLQIVTPKIHRIDFINTEPSLNDVYTIGKALFDPTGVSCIGKDILLSFNKPNDEDAIAIIVNVLGLPIRRIKVNDKFVDHHITTDSDFAKVELSPKMYLYLKSHFESLIRELDIHRIATVNDELISNYEIFRMISSPHIESLHINMDLATTSETLNELVQYLRFVTPNLKKLTLIHGFGLSFRSTSNLETLNTKINDFATDFVRQLTTDFNAQIELQFKLEVSVYKSDATSATKINWLEILKHKFLDQNPRVVSTELNNPAFSFQLDGPLDGSKILVRVHPMNGELTSYEVI